MCPAHWLRDYAATFSDDNPQFRFNDGDNRQFRINERGMVVFADDALHGVTGFPISPHAPSVMNTVPLALFSPDAFSKHCFGGNFTALCTTFRDDVLLMLEYDDRVNNPKIADVAVCCAQMYVPTSFAATYIQGVIYTTTCLRQTHINHQHHRKILSG